MLKRLAVLATSSSLLIGVTAPSWASPDGGVAPEPTAPSTIATGTPEVTLEARPQITSSSATADAITVSWTWGEGEVAPPEVTSVIVWVTPGTHELTVTRDHSAATIAGLDPATDYSVTLTAVAGSLVGEPSPPSEVRTLARIDTGSDVVDAAAVRPMATPGGVESLIVTMKQEVDPLPNAEAVTDELPIAGVSVDSAADLGAGNVRIDLSGGVTDSDAALMIAGIESDPRVESAVVDRRMFRTVYPATPPDDTYWTSNSLWGLYGTYGIGVAADRLTMNSVWTTGQGNGAVVAVLDSGSTAHPDLDANYVAGYDFVSNAGGSCRSGVSDSDGDYINTGTYGALGWDSNPLDPGDWTTVNTLACGYASSSSWHGTHVAGTVAAVGNNSIGVIGTAPLAKIQPVRVLSYDGGFGSDIIAAITWASGGSVSGVPANPTPADVINLSLGGAGTCDSAWQSAIDGAVARGSVVVVSAGNSTDDAAFYTPASCTNVITVASSTSAGVLSSFSNYGSSVEITAPGSAIWSTMNGGSTTPGSATYTSYSGTSMAAPHVAGVAALLKGSDPTRTPAQILTTLQSTALGFPTTGSWYDCTTSLCGAGLLRAAATTTPVIYSVNPDTGGVAGGQSVTLTGINMSNVSAATFGGSAATITAQTSTTLTVTTAARTSGAVDITLTNPDGSGTMADAFRYFDPPTATSLSVSSGSTAGGTTVIISGTDLAPNDVQDTQWISVAFGGDAATVWLPGTTSIQVTTPAHAAGAVDVVVTTPGGSSTLVGAFTYVAPPPPPAPAPPSGGGSSSSSDGGGGGGALQTITEVRPAFGPLSGGNLVAIIGYGFTGATSVTIGGKATTFRVINDATVEVTMPPGDALGSVDVAVNLTAARGRAFAPGGYVYVADTSVSAPPPATAPSVVGAPAPSTGGAEFITFRADSAVLTPATRAKLTRLAAKVAGTTATGAVTTFSDLRGTASSIRVAKARARNITRYLASQGVTGPITTTVEEGSTSSLRKGAVVRLSPDSKASTVTPTDRVNSLIVRYRKGVSPTIDGKVRGASLVTGGLGSGMTLGPNLGLRMYRVDFAAPVTPTQAERAATQMMKDRGIEFAEPDRTVGAAFRPS